MKKLLVFACVAISFNAMALGTIKGNGVLKTEKREVGIFTGLSSGGSMDVDIVYGSNSNLTIEGDENILPYIETIVEDGKLKVRVKDLNFIKPKLQLKVHINMTKITSIAQSGSGSITGQGDFTNEGETSFSMSGSGKIKLSFAKFSDASLSMSGSGSIELKGNISGDLSSHQSGSGRINCEEAPCANVNANISGSGSIRVNAGKIISAHISGSGDVYYVGNPTQIDSHVSGSGGIHKI